MKGYPKFIATKQDFMNLLNDPDYKAQALIDLQAICGLGDSKITRATTPIDPANPQSAWNTEQIDNPMPLWKIKGFDNREDVKNMIDEYTGCL